MSALVGRIEARIGLRMMPTFLDPPYHSVRRVFPSTAGRLAYQALPSPNAARLKSAPDYAACRPDLHPTFLHLVVATVSRTASGRWTSIMHRRPRQRPSMGSGLPLPVGHHLIGLLRPTRRHTAISPHGRLIRDDFTVREHRGDPQVLVRGFRCSFLPDMPSSRTPGSATSYQESSMPTFASTE